MKDLLVSSLLLSICAVVASTPTRSQADVLLDFDSLPDETWVSTQFESSGILFDEETWITKDELYAGVLVPSSPNYLNLWNDLGTITFVDPSDSTVPGVVESFQFDVAGHTNSGGWLAGFDIIAKDIRGAVLDTATISPLGPWVHRDPLTIRLVGPGIHSVEFAKIANPTGNALAPIDNLLFSDVNPLTSNLILNGSFEDAGEQIHLDTVIDPNTGLARDPAPTIPPHGIENPKDPENPFDEADPIYVLPPTSQAIAHWEVEIDPTLVNPSEPGATIDWTHSENYAASHEERSVDLNGTPGPGAIKQTFSTTPGATYDLLFDLAGNPVGNSVNPESRLTFLEEWGLTEDKIKYLRVELESNGTVFDSREYEFDVTGNTPEDLAWITEGWTFEAVGSETTLRFKSLAWSVEGESGVGLIDLMDFGPTIDNVRVYQASVPGDLDGDGTVGSADLDIVREHWNETVTPGDLSMGDISGDGYVGSADLDTVRANWGSSIAASVPEPSVLLLMTIGLSSLLLRRRAV